MKWLRTLLLFDQGDICSSDDWNKIHESYVRSILSIDYPEGSGSLTLRRKEQTAGGQWNRNGVVYLKNRFLSHLVYEERWVAEHRFDIGNYRSAPELRLFPGLDTYREPITSRFGSFDFVFRTPNGFSVAIEWETGNISSSHRSMNKLAIALRANIISAGVLIVPSRDLYKHLTDRIGNIGELSGYLTMWKDLEARIDYGLLAITVVEYDYLTNDSSYSYLPTGSDGRAHEGRAKRR